MSVRGGDGGSGNFGGFWDQPDERSVGPWIIGVVIAVGFAVMGSIMYLIFFTDTKAGSDSSVQSVPTSGPSSTGQPSAPAQTLTVPTAFDGYKPATGTAAKHALTTMRSSVTESTSTFAGGLTNAKSGVYAKTTGSSSRVMFFAESAADSQALAGELSTKSATSEVDTMLLSFKVATPHTYPAGQLGGALRCGAGKTKAGNSVTACGWSDKATSALVIEPSSITGTAAAKVALALRNAAEQ
jgi:hypothetical protein